jgi:hypothetical protein
MHGQKHKKYDHRHRSAIPTMMVPTTLPHFHLVDISSALVFPHLPFKMTSTRNTSSSSILRRSLVVVFLLLPFLTKGDSYRLGDAVDTLVWTKRDTADAMRAQMPQFGITSSVSFNLRDRFSLGFEEGLWALPWTETKTTRGHLLDKLLVKFVYSGGVIHSVSSEPIYIQMPTTTGSSIKRGALKIDYIWLEEEPVDIIMGASVMFLAALVASIIFLVQGCGIADSSGPESDKDNSSSYGGASMGTADSSAPGVPKWD